MPIRTRQKELQQRSRQKTVNGKAATGSQFHFTLTPKTDGDKNEAQNVTNVNGKITFADLTYDKAGTYEYEVAEVQDNLPNGYTADKTVYTATVTVTDDNSGQLKASVSYKKAEGSVDKLTFANIYKAKGTTAKIEAEDRQWRGSNRKPVPFYADTKDRWR